MGRIVIVAYKPKKGKYELLLSLVKKHITILRNEGLATERPAILMKSSSNTILEVFEWVSKEAIEQAHLNEAVAGLWEEFYNLCEFDLLVNIEEASKPFAEFEVIE